MDNPLGPLFGPQNNDDANSANGPRSVEVGVITSVSPLRVNCTGADENATAPVGVTFAVNDAVVILRPPGLAVAAFKIGVGSPVQPPLPDPVTGSLKFPAIYGWSWRDGQPFSFQDSVRQGAQDDSGAWTGAWFYQGGPAAALAGTTVTGCAIKVSRGMGGTDGSQPVHLYLSSTGVWPTADLVAPTTTGSAVDVSLSPGQSDWFDLPTSWGTALISGDVGVMVSGATPQVFLNGRDNDPESGLLRIDWTRP